MVPIDRRRPPIKRLKLPIDQSAPRSPDRRRSSPIDRPPWKRLKPPIDVKTTAHHVVRLGPCNRGLFADNRSTEGGIPQGWSFCWCFKTESGLNFVKSYPIDTALRIHSRYLISIAFFLNNFSARFYINFPADRFYSFAQRNIDPIVLSLLCHFQKVQNHFRSSKIGRVTSFYVCFSIWGNCHN